MDRVIVIVVVLTVITVTYGGSMSDTYRSETSQESKSGQAEDQESSQGHVIETIQTTYVHTPVVLAEHTPVVLTDGYAVYSPVDIGLDYDYVIPEGADLVCQKGFNIGTYVGSTNPFDAGICFFEYYVY